MKTSIKVIHWLPRIICILAILFIGLFAVDAFEPHLTIWQQIKNFLFHLIPTFILTVLLVIAWKWEYAGGIIFLLVGLGLSPFIFNLNYNRTHSTGTSMGGVLMVTFPFIVIGILFIISHFTKRRNLQTTSNG